MSTLSVDHDVCERMAQATIDLADAIELLRLHKFAHEGALAGISALQLTGEDVRAYLSSVTDNLERIDTALCKVDQQLQPVMKYLQAACEAPDTDEQEPATSPAPVPPTRRPGVVVRLRRPTNEAPA